MTTRVDGSLTPGGHRSHIEALPEELTLYIVNLLDTEDRISLGQCSRKLHRICHDKSVWKQLTISSTITPEAIAALLALHSEHIVHLESQPASSIMVEALPRLSNLTHLDLQPLKPEDTELLCTSMPDLTQLNSLKFTLPDEGVGIILEALASFTALTQLHIKASPDLGISFLSEHGEALMAALASMPLVDLKADLALHVDFFNPDEEACLERFAHAFGQLTRVEALDVAYNCFGDTGINAFADGATNLTRLRRLNLTNVMVTEDASGFPLPGALTALSALEELYIRENDLGCGSEEAIATSLAVCQQLTSLRVLDISNNHFNGWGARVGEMLRALTHLETLNLEHLGETDDEEYNHMLQCLPPSLTSLNIAHNLFSSVFFEFSHLPNLRHLNIACESFDPSELTPLTERLCQISSLESLQVGDYRTKFALDQIRIAAFIGRQGEDRAPPLSRKAMEHIRDAFYSRWDRELEIIES